MDSTKQLPVNTNDVLAIIMGGGQGTRLFPLTKERAKPAVPIGGKYRLVDVPISNCINSNMRKIYVLTQFNSASLHRHITDTYQFDRFSRGFVEILAAQQTSTGSSWYQGTADAVRQNLRFLLQHNCKYTVILSGDQLYHMDFSKVLMQHVLTEADITIATIPVKRQEASGFGILQVNESKRITRFVEKPKEAHVLEELKLDASLAANAHIQGHGDHFLASMGIYIFNTEVLHQVLDNNLADFGKHIIPDAIQNRKVYAYLFQGYWEDVGTIRSFFDANLALCSSKPSFDFFDRKASVYTRARFLPASKIIDTTINNALIADGCIILGSKIDSSIVGIRSVIKPGCILKDTVIMGCDFYGGGPEAIEDKTMGLPHMSIGKNCHITRAIIDKNCHLGDNVVITDKSNAPDEDGPNYYIRDGIVVIPKNTSIAAGTKI